MASKAKIPPMIKNGANGMYFWSFLRAQMPPKIHEINIAMARPVVPSHNPPVPNNFISPMPIGDIAFASWRRMR